MSELSDITTLVRQLLGDYSHTTIPGDIFTYSTSAVFTLSESNAIAVSTVLQNDTELDASDYSYDSDTNKVTISASLTANDTIEIRYTYYPNYSASEIENAIKAALSHLSVNNYYTFEIDSNGEIYPEPAENVKHLIGFIAATILEPDNKSYRLPDISIYIPKSLPTRDLIRKTISIFKHDTHGNFEIV